MASTSTDPPFELDYGRLRVCGDFLLSVNRSWRVEAAPGERPVAAFKTLAPIDIVETTEISAEIAAAIGPHDAYWLGFETDDDHPFAIVVRKNSVNLISGQVEITRPRPVEEPLNFLVVPDQPWFDAVYHQDGNYAQLIPAADDAANRIEIVVYRLSTDAFAQAQSDIEGPEPLYAQEHIGSQEAAQQHPYQSRKLIGELPVEPCATVVIQIMPPTEFEKVTGSAVDHALFEDGDDEPPAPFNPFGGD